MCNIEKNRINDLINKGQIKELDDYVDKYLELTKDFTSEEFFKVKREVIATIFNERYGTDFTGHEVSTIGNNASMSNLYGNKKYKFKKVSDNKNEI